MEDIDSCYQWTFSKTHVRRYSLCAINLNAAYTTMSESKRGVK
jgi:hypothetical protein